MVTKFRGKAKNASTLGFEAGDWLYGSLINNAFFFEDGTPACSIFDTNYIAYDCWEDLADWMDDFEVDPKTVGQWTGKKDKNGKEIYSDDLVVAQKYPFYSDGQLNYIAKVQWIFSSWQYVYILVNEELHGASHGINIGIDEIEDVEVIGNIHDNPELVK